MTRSPQDPTAQADKARNRFFALSMLRLFGAVCAMFGMAMMLERFGPFRGDMARFAGLALALFGMAAVLILPRLLARRWRSPPQA